MTQAHDHPELVALIDAMRVHVDSRFDLSDMQQQQVQRTLEDVVGEQRRMNSSVGHLQLWRAEISGTINGMKVAAGGARTLWLSAVAAVSTVAAVIAATATAVTHLAG